ncbi:MAG: GEVED domain-containing protein [Bacteroidota bacterium]|jgi:hypothetical protein
MKINHYFRKFLAVTMFTAGMFSRVLAQGPPPPVQYCNTNLYNNLCSTTNDFIDNFSTQGATININNIGSGCNGQPDNYEYVQGLSMTCSPGQIISVNLQAGPQWAQGFAVWIDWNQNGTLGDNPDELVYISPNASLLPFNGTFTVPSTASTGTTRMRVRCRYNAIPTDPCTTYVFGEVEDYDVIVGAPIPCPGTPVAGIAAASDSSVCPNAPFNLSLSGFSIGIGTAFQWQSSSDGINFTDIAGATNSFLNGESITDTTYYRCKVFCNTNSVNSNVVMVGINGFFSCYCNTNLGGACNTAGITEVSIDNTTLSNSGTLCDNLNGANYSVYPAADSTTASLNQAATYNFNVTTNGNAIISIWIDYDHSGTYDPSEWTQVSTTTTANTAATAAINIPVFALPGLTGMRVRSRASGNQNDSTSACQNFGSGSTQDYVVNIIAAVPCSGTPTPGVASASDSTICPNAPFSVTLTGYTIASGLSFQWQNSPDGIGFSNIPGATLPFINGLSITDTTYYRCIVSCNGSSATSNAVMVGINDFFTCYCNTNLGGGCNFAGITEVSIDNTTLSNSGTLCDNLNGPNYSVYPAADSTTASLDQLGVYNLNVNTNGAAIISVWIDYDHSGTYDANEWTQVATNSTANVVSTVQLTIPLNSLPGLTGMRIRSRSSGNINDANSACLNFGSGSTQDYVVNIILAPPCSGQPNGGEAQSSDSTVCAGSSINLSVLNATAASGLLYQWQSSADGVTFTDISTATSLTTTETINSSSYYRVVVTCNGLSANSLPVFVSVVNCVNMPLNSTDSVVTCSSLLYDSGGPNGNYQNGANDILTIIPATPGAFIQLNFSSFETELGYDTLFIYNGGDVSAPLMGTYAGTNSPGTVTAANASGRLTLRFKSDGSVVYPGWQASISCLTGPPACTENITPANGSTNVCLNVGVLNWDFTPLSVGYNVLFGTNPTLAGVTPVTVSTNSFDPGLLQANTTYYYQVVPFNSFGTPSNCAISSFTTGDCIEIIMSNDSINTCSGQFYSSGGPTGGYSNNENLTYVIHPSITGNSVQVSFNNFNVANDFLNVYDGADNNAPLIGSYTGAVFPPVLTAGILNPGNGTLTFEFTSNGFTTAIGWDATVSCIDPNTPPACAVNLNPFDGNTNELVLGNNLTWELGPGGGIPTGYNIYFGTQGNLALVDSNFNGTAYPLPQLNLNTIYCYQIVPVNASGQASGCPTSCFQTDTVLIVQITEGSDSICSGLFTDTGGPNGPYANNEQITYTIHPSTPGNALQLNFLDFAVEQGFDTLFIYDGVDNTAPLIGQYTGVNNPGLVTAGLQNPGNGSLTFVFSSDNSIASAGWTASINCINPNATPNCLAYTIADGDTGINPFAPITWEYVPGGGIPATYDVFMSTAGGPFTLVADNTTSQSYTPNPPLNTATEYCFYVVPSNAGGSPIGCDTVCFTTSSQAIILITNGSINTCSGNFFDSGGPTGNYQISENYVFTVYPATPGNFVRVVFNTFATETGFDRLRIYNGVGIAAANLLGNYSGTNLPPSWTSTDATTGALTFRFTSDASSVDSGWSASFSCVPDTNFSCQTPVITSTSGPVVCAGTTVTLNSSVSTVQWSTGATTPSISFVVNADTIITATNNAPGCSTVSQPYTIQVSTMPTPLISSNGTVLCGGQPLTISSSFPGVPVPPPTYTYLWSNGATTAGINVNAPGCYTLTASNSLGCSASSSQLCITGSSTPTITAGSATSFCSGGSVTLSTNATAGIQWFNGTTPVGSGLNTFNATQSGSYTAVVTAGNCVSTSNAITVTVNSVTVPTITASATEICTGGTATLTSSSDPNYVSYLWNNNLGTTASVTTQNSGTYTVTVTASNGCSATSASVTITVGGTITQPQVTIGGSTILCQGQTVTLLSSSITGNQWNFNGTPLTGATGVTFTADATGLYSVTVTANGCVSTSANIPVIVNPLPTASGSAVSQVGGITTFTNTSQNANAYQWNFGDQTAFSNDNNPVHTFTSDGEFTVVLTAYNSCGSDADTIQVNVFGTSVRALAHGEKLSMYPNPTHDQIMVDFSDNGSKNLRVNLVSITGEIVFTETLNSFSGKYKQLIDMQNLSSGIYFINIHTDRDTITRKVVKN